MNENEANENEVNENEVNENEVKILRTSRGSIYKIQFF